MIRAKAGIIGLRRNQKRCFLEEAWAKISPGEEIEPESNLRNREALVLVRGRRGLWVEFLRSGGAWTFAARARERRETTGEPEGSRNLQRFFFLVIAEICNGLELNARKDWGV